MKRYLTTGLINVDYIMPYDKNIKPFSRLGGGAIYALSALKLWSEDPLIVGYAGQDFDEFYGKWMKDNGLSTEGILKVVDKTTRSLLLYLENGVYEPARVPKWFSGARMSTNIQMLEPFLNEDIKAVHVMTHSNIVFFEQLNVYRKKYGFKVGSEMANAMDTPNAEEYIRTITDKYVDFYSFSYVEIQEYVKGIRDEKDAVDFCLSLKCPVYFRMGTKGAYYMINGKAYYFPMTDLFENMDPTGCGNTSTAAAFWAQCEGKDPEETGAIASVTASLNAHYVGPVSKIEPWMKDKCEESVKEILAGRRR